MDQTLSRNYEILKHCADPLKGSKEESQFVFTSLVSIADLNINPYTGGKYSEDISEYLLHQGNNSSTQMLQLF